MNTKDKVLNFIIEEHKKGNHYNAVEISLKLGLIKHEYDGVRKPYYQILERENKIKYSDGKWFPIE